MIETSNRLKDGLETLLSKRFSSHSLAKCFEEKNTVVSTDKTFSSDSTEKEVNTYKSSIISSTDKSVEPDPKANEIETSNRKPKTLAKKSRKEYFPSSCGKSVIDFTLLFIVTFVLLL